MTSPNTAETLRWGFPAGRRDRHKKPKKEKKEEKMNANANPNIANEDVAAAALALARRRSIMETLECISSRMDKFGNRYWALRFTDNEGRQVVGKVSGGESNISAIRLRWGERGDWDKSVDFRRVELSIREFNALTANWPYAGCEPEKLARYIRDNLNGYQQQAISFLDRFGFNFRATYKDGACPPWCGEDSTGCRHGDRYRITISRRNDYVCNEGRSPRRISFDYWNSEADMRAGKQPTPYDVLATISLDATAPETFEDFCDEYGYDRDSRKAESTFRRVDRFARRLRKFFVPHEIDALAEIR